MSLLLERLEVTTAAIQPRYPIQWSDGKKQELARIASGTQPVRDPIQPALAGALLKCADGAFADAECEILTILRDSASRGRCVGEAFKSLLQALFVVQRFDLVTAMLRESCADLGDLEIGVEEAGRHPVCLRWEILQSGAQRFMFDAAAYRNDRTTHMIGHLQAVLPLFANYAVQPERAAGSVLINQADAGVRPGFAFCDSRPDYFLLPDHVFVATRGYAHARNVLRENAIPWQDRKPVAFWRGSTTGRKPAPRAWRSLERVKLCELAQRHRKAGLFDVGLSKVTQFADPTVEQEIRDAGLLGGFVPWQEWGHYKYLIDIDGNSSPFSNLIQRLLTGSPVLKVGSQPGLRQWYYDELVPWQNYIPIAPDMTDLADKVKWLMQHDDFAEKVGQAGLALVERLTYEREMRRSVPVISAALRYFCKDYTFFSPYGGAARNTDPCVVSTAPN